MKKIFIIHENDEWVIPLEKEFFQSKIIDNDLTKMDKYVHSNTGLYIIDSNEKGKYKIVGSNLRNHLD